jgi:hypothetical protein
MTDRHENPNRRLTGSAAARFVNHHWGCPECTEVSGCRSSRRGCESCSPPRNPFGRAREWDE